MAYNPNAVARLKHTAALSQVVKTNQDELLADLDGKVDKVSGKGLSTNDYTTTEKNKLASIAAGAQVNVIETVKVNGTALTPSSKAVNIDISGKVDKVNGKGLSTNDYTTTEKNKLAGIADNANNYSLPVATTSTIGGVKVDSVANSNIVLNSSGAISVPAASTSQAGVVKYGGDSSKYLNGNGQWATPTNTTYAVATSSANGLMSANDKKTLDSVSSVYETKANAITGVAVSGQKLTFTKGDGATVTLNTQDTNTTYKVASSSNITINGTLVPSVASGTTNKYLRSDGTWQIPPNDNTTYSAMSGASSAAAGAAGLVPAPAKGKQASFLRGDGTWVVPTDTTYKLFNSTNCTVNGTLVPSVAASTTGKYLQSNGTWATPTGTTYPVATSSNNGLMSANDKKILDSVPSVYAKLSAGNTFSGDNTFSGKVILSKTTDASGTAAGNCALQIGDTAGSHLEFDGNEIMAKSNVSTPSALYINNDGGTTYFGNGGVSVKGGGVTVAAGGLTASNQTITAGTIKGTAASFTGNVTANNVYVPVDGVIGYSGWGLNGMKILNWNSSTGSDLIIQASDRLVLSSGETGLDAYNNADYGEASIQPSSEGMIFMSDRGYIFWCNVDANARSKITFGNDGNVTLPRTVTATTFNGNATSASTATNVTNATTGYAQISTAATETVKSATISNLAIRAGTLVALSNSKAGTSTDSTEINLKINDVDKKAYIKRSTPMKNSEWVTGFYLFVYSGSYWLCLSYPG